MAGGNYEKSMFHQLQETICRLEQFENRYKEDICTLKQENIQRIDDLTIAYEAKIHDIKQVVKAQAEEIVHLKQENQLLREDNTRLKSLLNNDSNNSSLPPSTDQNGKQANQYNSRKKTGKPKGAQLGHKGKTLTKEAVRVQIEAGMYKHEVVEHGDVQGEPLVKYVVDICITPCVTEHRFYPDNSGRYSILEVLHSDVTYGNVVQALAVQLYGVGVVSNERIRELINSVSGGVLKLSAGGVYKMIRRFSESVGEEIEKIKQELLNENVLHTDGTNITVNGKQAYIRNVSSADSVQYSYMEKKNLESLGALPVLSGFTGTLMHDHETALYHFGTRHGECNVHLLRYLTKNTEDTGHAWCMEMHRFLCCANKERKHRIASGSVFTNQEQTAFEERYDHFCAQGQVENNDCKPKWAKKAEKSLLRRLEKYKKNHLLFLHDFCVPFDNNLSERDLRKCKTRQKMAGGFRSNDGALMYCDILSFLETCKRRACLPFASILSVLQGIPVLAALGDG